MPAPMHWMLPIDQCHALHAPITEWIGLPRGNRSYPLTQPYRQTHTCRQEGPAWHHWKGGPWWNNQGGSTR